MRTYIPKGWRCDKERYQELIHFCRQYRRWKQENADIRFEYRAAMNGSIAVQSSGNGMSPVETKADRLIKNDEKIDLIESCCREAVAVKPQLYPFLLRSVTEGIPIERLNAPIGRKAMGKYKQAFIYLLDERKE